VFGPLALGVTTVAGATQITVSGTAQRSAHYPTYAVP